MQDLKVLYKAVIEGDARTAKRTTEQALAGGVKPLELVQDYLMPAMAEVGRRFETNEYFGQPPNVLAGPRADPDGDGQDNLFEYTVGLNPTNANLVFRLRLEAVPSQPSQKRAIFSPLVAGRSYTVKFRTNLMTGPWTTLTSATQSDTGSERTVTDLSATAVKKFYQVEISKP